MTNCASCNHTWESKSKDPKRCPSCNARMKKAIPKPEPTDLEIHLRSEVKRLSNDNKKLRLQSIEEEEVIRQIAGAVASSHIAVPKIAPFNIKKSDKDKTLIVPVLKLSDWHIGEVINPSELVGFNAGFDWNIAQERMWYITEKFLKWIDVQRTAYRIEELAVFAEGDWVSGEIHDEYKRTNEFTLLEQTAHAGDLLGAVVARLSQNFANTTLVEVGGDNHGRLSLKPPGKQKASTNMAFIVYKIANAIINASKVNVKVYQPEDMKAVVTVNNFNFLVEHGDTIRGIMGIPYYGMSRMRNMEQQRRAKIGQPFHYWSIGHFHVPAVIEADILVNGALTGTSEFDHSHGRFVNPAQTSFLVHPKHGVFNWTAWWAK